ARFHHDALTHPLPKLRLRGPKLFLVAANHECRLLLALLLFVRVNSCAHADTPRSLRNRKRPHTVPRREASLARQQQVVKPADEHPLPFVTRNACEFDGCLTQRLSEVSERNWSWL